MDGDGPCRDERYLPIGPDPPVLDALAFFVPLLPNFLPLRMGNKGVVTAPIEAHEDPTIAIPLTVPSEPLYQHPSGSFFMAMTRAPTLSSRCSGTGSRSRSISNRPTISALKMTGSEGRAFRPRRL